MTDLTLLHESLRRNGRVNGILLSALTEPDLHLCDGRGGFTLGQLLGHMAGFRVGWLSEISPVPAEVLSKVLNKQDVWLWQPRDSQEVADAFHGGDELAVRAVQDALAEGRSLGSYKSHPAHFLQQIIVHDAHHRGQIMTLLRQGGRTPEQMAALEGATWAIWHE